jgi:hypothetical protein
MRQEVVPEAFLNSFRRKISCFLGRATVRFWQLLWQLATFSRSAKSQHVDLKGLKVFQAKAFNQLVLGSSPSPRTSHFLSVEGIAGEWFFIPRA